jgi:hypothetical protein
MPRQFQRVRRSDVGESTIGVRMRNAPFFNVGDASGHVTTSGLYPYGKNLNARAQPED